MRSNKHNSIHLYKQPRTQADSNNIGSSRSKSRLRDSIKKLDLYHNYGQISSRVNPQSYNMKNTPILKVCNMNDNQIRIKRDYSPLYQKSQKQSQLFEKGVKKPVKNINLQSKIILVDNLHAKNDKNSNIQDLHSAQLTSRSLKRQNPNKQNYNIFDLDSSPAKYCLTPRIIPNKINPNKQSQYKQSHTGLKSLIRDPNKQTSQTGDYVIKALGCHVDNNNTCGKSKQIHLKFHKKENVVNKENFMNKENSNSVGDQLVPKHKRHYSNLTTTNAAIRKNIQIRENGICVKEQNKKGKQNRRKNNGVDFDYDYFNNQSRTLKPNQHRNTIAQPSTQRIKTVTYNKSSSRVRQLRKRFL